MEKSQPSDAGSNDNKESSSLGVDAEPTFSVDTRSQRMSRSEAGRLGGMRTAQTHDREFYSGIGRQGGRAVSREYGSQFYAEIGREGGRASGRSRSRNSGNISNSEDQHS